jgi:hypothetical protein
VRRARIAAAAAVEKSPAKWIPLSRPFFVTFFGPFLVQKPFFY